MKNLITLLLLVLLISTFSSAQDTLPKSDGYLLVQMITITKEKAIFNIILPSGESKQIEGPVKMPLIPSRDTIKEVLSKNAAKLLEILEAYRKDGYALVGISNEFQGIVTNYWLAKKQSQL